MIIAVPNVLNIIEGTKKDSFKNQIKLIENMAEVYAISEPLTYDDKGIAKITLKDLVDEGIATKNIIDPMCGKPFSQDETYIEVTDINGKLEYNVIAITGCNADLPPFINDISNITMNNQVTLSADTTNGGANITKYYYSKDNGANYIESINSTYTFYGLDIEQEYTFKVKVEDSKNKETISDDIVITTKPTYVPDLPTTHIPITTSNTIENGLIPITYDETLNNWVVADTSKEWYNYDKKEWANAISVTESSRNAYLPGKELVEDDVLAYFVYIPRYSYTLFNVESAEIEPLSIPIKFVDVNTKTAQSVLDNPQNGNEYVHPAFTFGDDELAGIWVGKFELTPLEQDYEVNDVNVIPTIKPGISSLRYQNISTFFTTIQKFNDSNTYGINNNADSHMIKNTEWGAMTYLSHSIYGINDEVRINNNSEYLTGCGAQDEPNIHWPNYLGTSACENSYLSSFYNQPQSTTGNKYGVYDTSGGTHEYVMAVNDLGNENNNDDSGFTKYPLLKYYDNYKYGESYDDMEAMNRRILGDATGEVIDWYEDFPRYVSKDYAWFRRGSQFNHGLSSGMFYFHPLDGQQYSYLSTRPVIPQFKK